MFIKYEYYDKKRENIRTKWTLVAWWQRNDDVQFILHGINIEFRHCIENIRPKMKYLLVYVVYVNYSSSYIL